VRYLYGRSRARCASRFYRDISPPRVHSCQSNAWTGIYVVPVRRDSCGGVNFRAASPPEAVLYNDSAEPRLHERGHERVDPDICTRRWTREVRAHVVWSRWPPLSPKAVLLERGAVP